MSLSLFVCLFLLFFSSKIKIKILISNVLTYTYFATCTRSSFSVNTYLLNLILVQNIYIYFFLI